MQKLHVMFFWLIIHIVCVYCVYILKIYCFVFILYNKCSKYKILLLLKYNPNKIPMSIHNIKIKCVLCIQIAEHKSYSNIIEIGKSIFMYTRKRRSRKKNVNYIIFYRCRSNDQSNATLCSRLTYTHSNGANDKHDFFSIQLQN